ncbi:MAG: Fe-Mn family superoxide dismutase [bacterium]
MSYTERKFAIGDLTGISAKTIEEHLKLYSGYVKNTNLIIDSISSMSADAEKNALAISEAQRRFGFEFDGMRNHEYYFEQLEGGAKPLSSESELGKSIATEWGSFDTWMSRFKTLAMTRGVGWAILYKDQTNGRLVHAWVEEQHLGHLTGLKVILALDMWEHSYMLDYVPSEKKKYIDAFFTNLNGSVVESRF